MRFLCPTCGQALLAQQSASATQVKFPFCATNCMRTGICRSSVISRDGKGEAFKDLAKLGSVGNKVMVAASFDRDYLRFFATRDSFE